MADLRGTNPAIALALDPTRDATPKPKYWPPVILYTRSASGTELKCWNKAEICLKTMQLLVYLLTYPTTFTQLLVIPHFWAPNFQVQGGESSSTVLQQFCCIFVISFFYENHIICKKKRKSPLVYLRLLASDLEIFIHPHTNWAFSCASQLWIII